MVDDPTAHLSRLFFGVIHCRDLEIGYLEPGLLVVELKGHVSKNQFEESVTAAQKIGLKLEPLSTKIGGRVALLSKPGI